MTNILFDKKNYRKHPDKNKQVISGSLVRNGAGRSILLDRDNTIIAGNGVFEQANKLNIPVRIIETDGNELIAVKRIDIGENDDKRKDLAISDNISSDTSEFDMGLLTTDFDNKQLLDMGFNIKDLPQEDIVEDEAPPAPEIPRTVKGDIYQLGNHRVMCGDSTIISDVEKLMDGKLADMIHTDPPYNIDYGVSKNPRHKIRTIANDKQGPEQWEAFCKDLYEIFRMFNKGDIYMWGASAPEGMKMRLWLVEAGCHWSTTIIWKKDRLVLTPANYQRMYEPCFYGWFNKSSFEADRKEVEVWDLKRPSDSKLHPTMKPIELCAKAINNSSKFRDTILDLFLGSGSTLIACEQTNRICYGMELDERYMDVIVQRWVNLTGGKVILNGNEVEWPKNNEGKANA